MLENYVIPELQQRNAINDIAWMQDGALPDIITSVRLYRNSLVNIGTITCVSQVFD